MPPSGRPRAPGLLGAPQPAWALDHGGWGPWPAPQVAGLRSDLSRAALHPPSWGPGSDPQLLLLPGCRSVSSPGQGRGEDQALPGSAASSGAGLSLGVPASCPGAWVLEAGGRERKATWLNGTSRVQLCFLIPRSEWINRPRLLLLFFHYPQAAFPVGLSSGSTWLWCTGTLSHPGLPRPCAPRGAPHPAGGLPPPAPNAALAREAPSGAGPSVPLA